MTSRNRGPNLPWMSGKRSKNCGTVTDDPLVFHQEIMNFVRYIRLNSEEKAQRNKIIEALTAVILAQYPSAKVEVYGSFETDLCIRQSDIDVVVFGTGMTVDEVDVLALYDLSNRIVESGLSDGMPMVISTAKVPIIKFKEAKNGVMVDISFERQSALETTELVKNYVKRYPMLRPMTIVLKYYLKQRFLNETWSGGIGSYTLVVMILSFLQLQTSTGGRTRRADAGEDLSTLLINFLQFYGTQFDYFHSVISVIKGGRYLRKEDKNWVSSTAPDALSVEDPTDTSSDIAARSYRINDARDVFMEGFYRLTRQSSRWQHTHSFLARLFEFGPNVSPSTSTSSTNTTTLMATPSHISASSAKFKMETSQDYAAAMLHAPPLLPAPPHSSIIIPSANNTSSHFTTSSSFSPPSTSPSSSPSSTSPISSSASSSSPLSYTGLPSTPPTHSPRTLVQHPTKTPHPSNGTQSQNSNHSNINSSSNNSSNNSVSSNTNSTQNQIQTQNNAIGNSNQKIRRQNRQSNSASTKQTTRAKPKQQTPPNSPSKDGNNNNSYNTSKSAPTTPRKRLALDPSAPEYAPLFPPLPSKLSGQRSLDVLPLASIAKPTLNSAEPSPASNAS